MPPPDNNSLFGDPVQFLKRLFMHGTAASTHPIFNVVVIGGGPAGLVAATYLARFRRTVCVVDADRSRLAKIPRSHDNPGFADGIAGPQSLLNLREQVARYPSLLRPAKHNA